MSVGENKVIKVETKVMLFIWATRLVISNCIVDLLAVLGCPQEISVVMWISLVLWMSLPLQGAGACFKYNDEQLSIQTGSLWVDEDIVSMDSIYSVSTQSGPLERVMGCRTVLVFSHERKDYVRIGPIKRAKAEALTQLFGQVTLSNIDARELYWLRSKIRRTK